MTNADIKSKDIKLVAIADLKENPKNRNTHPKDQIERLVEIIRHQGFRQPIVVSNRSGLVVAGHGRLLAAKELRLVEVPVMYQDFESEEQEYAFGVSDNAIAAWAELDLSGINFDVPELGPDFDLDMLGIKDFVLEPAEKFEAQSDEDSVPEHVEPRAKLGDIYQLGRHRLMCGDSTSIDAVEKLMAGEKADMVFTDPPYGVNYDGGHANEKRREKLANDHSVDIYGDSVPLMVAFSKDNAALYLWFAATKSLQVLQVLQENNYEVRSWLIWNKNMAQFGAIGAQYKQKHEPCLYAFKKGNSPFWDGPTNEVSVWDVARASKNEFHPTQKPVELSRRAITNSSPRSGIILDLFGGSGSTLIGAEAEGRSARVMELSPNYVDVIVSRWEKYTGQKAELLNV
jgi:DNA modification methylase